MLTRFTHKRVIITGGASGLGRAIVHQFAKLGWKIAVVDINLDGATEVATEANKMGAEALPLFCDVGKDEDFISIAALLKEKWGGLDVIVNNAGIATTGMLVDCPPEQWHRAINLNLTSVYRGCNYWLPLIEKNGPGHIVNTASAAGLLKAPSTLSYNVSKAGVVALSESICVELAHRDIGVSVICPSFFKTNLLDSMTAEEQIIRPLIEKWMESSDITADDVAADVITGIENNELIVISHEDAKQAYLHKREQPEHFIKEMSANVPKIIASMEKLRQQ